MEKQIKEKAWFFPKNSVYLQPYYHKSNQQFDFCRSSSYNS